MELVNSWRMFSTRGLFGQLLLWFCVGRDCDIGSVVSILREGMVWRILSSGPYV